MSLESGGVGSVSQRRGKGLVALACHQAPLMVEAVDLRFLQVEKSPSVEQSPLRQLGRLFSSLWWHPVPL